MPKSEAESLFTCALCGKDFPMGWTDEEARAEFEQKFPDLDIEDAEQICDPCYRLVTQQARGH
jgi:hypothetical protein